MVRGRAGGPAREPGAGPLRVPGGAGPRRGTAAQRLAERVRGTGLGPHSPDGQWYLHLFAPEQPDLDWTNDEVRAEFESILRFWLDRGVDGFRIDVAHGLAKDPALPDLAVGFAVSGAASAGHPHWDRDDVHDVYRQWRRVTDSYDRDVAFVAEAWVETPVQLARYLRPDELHTAFNFEFLQASWDAAGLRTAIDTSIDALAEVGAPPTWVLSNHDVVRHVTRYGGGEEGVRRARAAALLMLALPGGAYVYQGEELGLPQVTDLPDEVLQDPTFFRTGGAERGRDGCRVPLPWSGSASPFGFGPDGSRPWLPQPSTWDRLTAERQAADPDSVLSLYRAALRVRRELDLGDTPLEWVDSGADDVLAFRRGAGFACVVNLGDEAVDRPQAVGPTAPVVLASGPLPRRRKNPRLDQCLVRRSGVGFRPQRSPADRDWEGSMDRRKLVVALVGAVGLSLMVSPAEASTSAVVVHQGPDARLVVHPCTPPVNALHLALHAAARALAGHAVVFRAEAAKLHRVHVDMWSTST